MLEVPDYGFELLDSPYRHYRYKGSRTVGGTYKQGGRTILSVTTVLGGDVQKLIDWNVGQAWLAAEKLGAREGVGQLAEDMGISPNAVRERAAVRGTRAHSQLTRLALGQPLDTGADYDYGLAKSIEAWQAKHRPSFVHNEVAVGHDELGYAGTFDATMFDFAHPTRPGMFVLYDAKTTNSSQPKHAYQVAAYEMARRHCGARPTEDQAVLYLDGAGGFTVVYLSELPGGLEGAYEGFLAALTLARRNNATKMPPLNALPSIDDYSIDDLFAKAHRTGVRKART